MHMVCLDLEGVLVPEIWIAFSRATGITELSLTTRDIADYNALMQRRLQLLRRHNLKLMDIQQVISTLEPLNGGCQFLDGLRAKTQVIILSDTFTQFAQPLMKKLGFPTLFCNSLEIDRDGCVTGYRLRQKDGKRQAVTALQQIGFRVFAAGDSYNDLSMIIKADCGAFFKAPPSIRQENPAIPAVEEYPELAFLVDDFLKV